MGVPPLFVGLIAFWRALSELRCFGYGRRCGSTFGRSAAITHTAARGTGRQPSRRCTPAWEPAQAHHRLGRTPNSQLGIGQAPAIAAGGGEEGAAGLAVSRSGSISGQARESCLKDRHHISGVHGPLGPSVSAIFGGTVPSAEHAHVTVFPSD